jgi:sialate O-acetylesterase
MAAFLLVLLPAAAARADVKPHGLFTDGVVLQRDGKAVVWGKADDGEQVTVKFRGNEASAAAQSGKWKVEIDAGAAGGPFELVIAGKNTITLKDVYVGEVWVCSGQSNMDWTISQSDASDKKLAADAPADPLLRLFRQKNTALAEPADDVNPSFTWTAASPQVLPNFSAVGYFFGRNLRENLKVPVCLIHTAWGGTRAEAWTSRAVLSADPDYKGEIESFDKAMERFKADPEGLFKDQVAAAKKQNKPEPKAVQNPASNANAPTVLYNGMVHPFLNFRIRGVIWYQGESNAGKAYAYRKLFPMMIKNWRDDWKAGEFPFLFVQLAPYMAYQAEPADDAWAELREAQAMTLKNSPNTGMAVITDFGNEGDIHPTPKRTVGERLALIARAKTYGEKIEYSGPVVKDLKFEGPKVVLTFDHAEGGPVAKEIVPAELKVDSKTGKVAGAAWRVKPGSAGINTVLGFAVCGEDKKWHNAAAEIIGETVVVISPAVDKPVAVRYGWGHHPIVNLFNKAGLPASPFRSDDFPAVTAPKPKS